MYPKCLKFVEPLTIYFNCSFSTAGTLQMGIELDSVMRNNIMTTNGLINDFDDNMNYFRQQIEDFSICTNDTLGKLVDLVKCLPQNTTKQFITQNIEAQLKKNIKALKCITHSFENFSKSGINYYTTFLFRK